MPSERRAVAGLRLFLVMLFAVLVLFQVTSLPGQFRFMAEQDPETAYLRWPATVVASDPGLPLLLFLLTVGVTVLGLLMIVMRALLRRASSLRADLEDVI